MESKHQTMLFHTRAWLVQISQILVLVLMGMWLLNVQLQIDVSVGDSQIISFRVVPESFTPSGSKTSSFLQSLAVLIVI